MCVHIVVYIIKKSMKPPARRGALRFRESANSFDEESADADAAVLSAAAAYAAAKLAREEAEDEASEVGVGVLLVIHKHNQHNQPPHHFL